MISYISKTFFSPFENLHPYIYDGDKEYNALYNKGFHFVKVKRIKNIPKRAPLKLPNDINYIFKNIH